MAVYRRLACGTGVLILTILALTATGCGGDQASASVGGTVKWNGAPLTSGEVNLVSKSGAGALAKIDESGAYKVDGKLDAGEYKVSITPPSAEPPPPGTTPAPVKLKPFPVPTKYRDVNTSGLTLTVKSGRNDLPIILAD